MQILKYVRAKTNLQVINIVRREDQAKLLKEEFGQEYVFVEDSPSFKENIRAAIEKLGATVFFDAVGGGSASSVTIFEALPEGGQMVIYGLLNPEALKLNAKDLLYKDKTIRSFFVLRWLAQLAESERAKMLSIVRDDLAGKQGGERVFETRFTKELPLHKWEEAVKQYREVASKEHGKILINCQ